jgi:hypothetical protein
MTLSLVYNKSYNFFIYTMSVIKKMKKTDFKLCLGEGFWVLGVRHWVRTVVNELKLFDNTQLLQNIRK